MADESTSHQWRVGKRHLFRAFVYLIALLGCSFQSGYICRDYFQYPTTTYFTILDSLPTITPPTVTLSFPYKAKIGTSLKDLFSNIGTNITAEYGQVKIGGKLRVFKGQTAIRNLNAYIGTSISYRMGYYQISIFLKGNWNYTSSIYLDGLPMLDISFRTNLWWSRENSILTFMTGRNGDLEADAKTIPILGFGKFLNLQAFLTYSIKVIERLPPPFDTKCRNYERYGFSSRQNCFSECLTDFTKRHGKIIESNVIPRNRYENSTLELAPWYLATLMLDGREVTAEDINDRRISAMYPLLKGHWKECNRICRLRDCIVESLFPFTSTTEYDTSTLDSPLSKEEKMTGIGVFPPHNQVIKVISQAKLGLLDLIVYIVCALSFWFGFCPLQVTQILRLKWKPLTRVIEVMKAKIKTTKWSLVIHILPYLFVTCGFLYESQHICDQYFRYPTITSVSMIDAQPLTIPPKITTEFWHPRRTGVIASDIFKYYPDDTWVLASIVRKGFRGNIDDGLMNPDPTRRKSAFFDVTPFSKMGMYFVTISLRNQSMAFSPEELFTFGKEMYTVVLKTNLVSRVHKRANQIKFYVTPHNADMEGIQMSVGIMCTLCFHRTIIAIFMTYTLKESKLLPPPYDTNCRNYRETTKFSSKSNCFSECLNQFMRWNGMVLEDSVLMRDQFENSSLLLAPWQLKDLQGNGKPDEELQHLIGNGMAEPLQRKIMNISSKYQDHWKRCKNFCSQPDCRMQSIIPFPLTMAPANGESVNRSDTSQFSMFYLRVFPPNDQLIVVESNSKISLIDVIVYSLSSLSFWFGFSPFEFVKKIKASRKRKARQQLLIMRRQNNQFCPPKLLRYPVFRKLLRLILYVLILSEFVYQTWIISEQFFKYETTSHVTMESSSREFHIPKLILSIEHNALKKEKIGFTVKKVFSQIRDKTELHEVQVRRLHEDSIGNTIQFKRYLKLKHYIMSFEPLIATKYSHDNRTEPLMKISLQTNVIMKGDTGSVPVIIQSHNSDNEGHQKVPLIIPCILGYTECTMKLTFSSKNSQLLPAPYDTNCRNYRTVNATTRDHCLNSCLNQLTEKHGMFLETNLADRDKMQNSSLILAPWQLKTMTEKGTKLSASDFLSSEKLRYHLTRGANVSKEYFKKLADILPSYQNDWSQCKNRCSQANCYTESTLAELISYENHGDYSKISNLTFIIYPTKDPVILTVTSTAKMDLLDFIVYILSSLSFWFGFCPLQLADVKRPANKKRSCHSR